MASCATCSFPILHKPDLNCYACKYNIDICDVCGALSRMTNDQPVELLSTPIKLCMDCIHEKQDRKFSVWINSVSGLKKERIEKILRNPHVVSVYQQELYEQIKSNFQETEYEEYSGSIIKELPFRYADDEQMDIDEPVIPTIRPSPVKNNTDTLNEMAHEKNVSPNSEFPLDIAQESSQLDLIPDQNNEEDEDMDTSSDEFKETVAPIEIPSTKPSPIFETLSLSPESNSNIVEGESDLVKKVTEATNLVQDIDNDVQAQDQDVVEVSKNQLPVEDNDVEVVSKEHVQVEYKDIAEIADDETALLHKEDVKNDTQFELKASSVDKSAGEMESKVSKESKQGEIKDISLHSSVQSSVEASDKAKDAAGKTLEKAIQQKTETQVSLEKQDNPHSPKRPVETAPVNAQKKSKVETALSFKSSGGQVDSPLVPVTFENECQVEMELDDDSDNSLVIELEETTNQVQPQTNISNEKSSDNLESKKTVSSESINQSKSTDSPTKANTLERGKPAPLTTITAPVRPKSSILDVINKKKESKDIMSVLTSKSSYPSIAPKESENEIEFIKSVPKTPESKDKKDEFNTSQEFIQIDVGDDDLRKIINPARNAQRSATNSVKSSLAVPLDSEPKQSSAGNEAKVVNQKANYTFTPNKPSLHPQTNTPTMTVQTANDNTQLANTANTPVANVTPTTTPKNLVPATPELHTPKTPLVGPKPTSKPIIKPVKSLFPMLTPTNIPREKNHGICYYCQKYDYLKYTNIVDNPNFKLIPICKTCHKSKGKQPVLWWVKSLQAQQQHFIWSLFNMPENQILKTEALNEAALFENNKAQ
ncbi:hypothetical protein HDV04_004597 [Boothiomyces sp. JEL0838]|nr:hypothetical protein HDV04_004597 [Boothiomyces sp. JEL0838]